MTIADCLDALRSDIPGCQVAAFGDIAAHLILKASHDASVPREVLDRLCAEAADCFATAQGLEESGNVPQSSVVLTTLDMRIYLRAPERADFLCLLCPLDSNPDLVLPKGKAVLT